MFCLIKYEMPIWPNLQSLLISKLFQSLPLSSFLCDGRRWKATALIRHLSSSFGMKPTVNPTSQTKISSPFLFFSFHHFMYLFLSHCLPTMPKLLQNRLLYYFISSSYCVTHVKSTCLSETIQICIKNALSTIKET